MANNTSIGRGVKGSKFWIQTLINLDGGSTLQKAIQSANPSIGNITWVSPLKSDQYREYEAKDLSIFSTASWNFWPSNGPLWDGVGVDNLGNILLVEAKAHTSETESQCKAVSTKSIAKIDQTMRDAHASLSASLNIKHSFDHDAWFKQYYQLGNRLSFIVKLREQGFNVKLILLNIVNDSTYIPTDQESWNSHYSMVFKKMLGSATVPSNVSLVFVDVG